MAADPSTPPSSAYIDWYLGITRLQGVRRRIEREGLHHDAACALQETFAELAQAAIALDVERALGMVLAGRPS